MIDDRDLFERSVQRFAPADGSFERLVDRRDRKKRNQRIAAAVVGIAAALAVALTGASLIRSEPKPLNPTPTPSVRNGEITVSDYPADGDGLRAIDPADGTVHLLVPCVQDCYETHGVEWSPDGTQLVYFETSYEDPSLNGIYVLDIASGGTTSLAHCANTDGCVQDGLSWSPDGSRIAYPDRREIVLVDPDGSDRTTIPARSSEGRVGVPSWSPDGSRIAYTEGDEIVVIDAAGSNPTTLPLGSFNVTSELAWSPDGTQIAFSGSEGDVDRVYVMNLSGSGLTMLAEGSMYEGPRSPSWSPDGTQILYFATPKEGDRWGSQVWVISPDGSNRNLLVDFACCQDLYGGTWSPDGTKIAFVTIVDPDEPPYLYVMNADGSDLTKLIDSWGGPLWQPIPIGETS